MTSLRYQHAPSLLAVVPALLMACSDGPGYATDHILTTPSGGSIFGGSRLHTDDDGADIEPPRLWLAWADEDGEPLTAVLGPPEGDVDKMLLLDDGRVVAAWAVAETQTVQLATFSSKGALIHHDELSFADLSTVPEGFDVTTLVLRPGGLLVGVSSREGDASSTRLAAIDGLDGVRTVRFAVRLDGDALATSTNGGTLALTESTDDAGAPVVIRGLELDDEGAAVRAFRLETTRSALVLDTALSTTDDEVLLSVSEGWSGDEEPRTANVLRLDADRLIRWQRAIADNGLTTAFGTDAEGVAFLALSVPPTGASLEKGDIGLIAFDDAGEVAYQWVVGAESNPEGMSVIDSQVFVTGYEYERGNARWQFSESGASGCEGEVRAGSFDVEEGSVTATAEVELPAVAELSASLHARANVFETVDVSADDVAICR
ncbi:MAG: hypothetical protein HOW73_49365 [Polyangiaceae bacterium]|nr:hypothetical protein [Polyangiaceae bacterium]